MQVNNNVSDEKIKKLKKVPFVEQYVVYEQITQTTRTLRIINVDHDYVFVLFLRKPHNQYSRTNIHFRQIEKNPLGSII